MLLSSQGQQHSVLDFIVDKKEHLHDVSDNLKIRKIGSIYYCNDKPCEGLVTDYYDKNNTKIRLTGIFKKGIPKGIMTEYHENGVVKTEYIPFNKKYKYSGKKYNYCKFTEFDECGNCVRYIDDIEGVEKKYDKDEILSYKLIYNRKKSSLIYYSEYYPEGDEKTIIKKGNRYDYDEKALLRRHWVRKSERYNKKHAILSATFYFEEYDISGKVSKTGRFYSNLYEHDHWLHITPEFPASIDMVAQQDFKEIVYTQLKIKDVYRWDYANSKTIITRYKQQGDSWIETGKRSLPRIISSSD